ncbi:MAG TPA: putative Se/S carrier-like protein, partial [Desulfuromonadaceae bacterium]
MIQNGQLLAVFNSAHRVMKAEYVLKRCGLEILLIPAPRA